MKYRDHKGGFDESMKTLKNFNSIEEIKKHLTELNGREVVEIKFEYAGYDVRNMWNSSYVMQKFKGEKTFVPAGFSDGQLNK